MQMLPRWRNALGFKNSLIQFTCSIHSTSTCFEKRKYKWDFEAKREQPSKTYIRYQTRQKRADAKKALNDILLNSYSSKFPFEGIGTRMSDDGQTDDFFGPKKKDRPKQAARRTHKAEQQRMRRKQRKKSFSQDFDDEPERVFEAVFGNKWYTMSYKSWQGSFPQGSTSGFEWRQDSNFEWREESKRSNSRHKDWSTLSDEESDDDDEPCLVGSRSDRTILGLPPSGPLNINDVKTAFRLSALKWHPDKHQGSSQAMAEEKFKSCVSAYKSLCTAVSGV